MRPADVLILAAFAMLPFAGGLRAAEDAGCSQETMIVFDASGSMGGTDLNSVTPRIGKVRQALANVLPEVAPYRPLGLIVYGPGATHQCESIELRLRPALNAAGAIMGYIDDIVPAGRTPLTAAVRQAAEVLHYTQKPATIVLITDGEETCGGDPCGLAGNLKAKADNLTIHVIGYRDRLATSGPFGSRCMADVTGGTYVSVETTDELVSALRATLGCANVARHDARLDHYAAISRMAPSAISRAAPHNR